MNAPIRTPPTDPNAELFDELVQLAWAIGVHSDSLQNYCALRDQGGANYALGCLTDCMRRSLRLFAEMHPKGERSQ
jgi:hypothetical protein